MRHYFQFLQASSTAVTSEASQSPSSSTTATATTTAASVAAPTPVSSAAKADDLPSFRDKKKFFEQEIQGHAQPKQKEKGRLSILTLCHYGR